MSICVYTAFDRVIHLVKPLPKEKIAEGMEIIQEMSLDDLLDFCIENDCFDEVHKDIIHSFIDTSLLIVKLVPMRIISDL